MRASFLSSLVLLAACTVANPAYETSETAADTIAVETTEGGGPGSGEDTVAPPSTTGIDGTTTMLDGTTSPEVDTGIESSDTGIESCLPIDPGRPLDLAVFSTATETCAGPEITGSVVDFKRIVGTDHFEGRLCRSGCGMTCLSQPGTDDIVRIEVPADLATVLDPATCIELNAYVDHEDECRVDHFAIWIDGQNGKTPELVGATNDTAVSLVGSYVLPAYTWTELQMCGEQCSDANEYPGVWEVEFEGGTVLDHNSDVASAPLIWLGGNTAAYHVRNLQSFIGEDCIARMAWVARKQL